MVISSLSKSNPRKAEEELEHDENTVEALSTDDTGSLRKAYRILSVKSSPSFRASWTVFAILLFALEKKQ